MYYFEVLYSRCTEERRLLDAYLMALTNDDAAQSGLRSGDTTAREARELRDRLICARDRYWRHVRRHNCRSVAEESSAAST